MKITKNKIIELFYKSLNDSDFGQDLDPRGLSDVIEKFKVELSKREHNVN